MSPYALLALLPGLATGAAAAPAVLQARSSSLSSLCTTSNIASIVGAFDDLTAVTYDLDAITTNLVTNHTVTPQSGGPQYPSGSGIEFCNVSIAFSHEHLNDTVINYFYLPDPSTYANRYLTNGGGGWSVDGSGALDAGLVYDAVSGATDGGFGYGGELTAELLNPVNGTVAWSRLESFGFEAIHQLTVNGKALARGFYNITTDELKSYYLGCSEGGREGHQSTQKYPYDFDGVVAAAPAMYFPIMQLAQAWPNIAMAQLNHWPSPCAFQTVQEDIIAECDPLDGRTDGVISRSDLCSYDTSNSVGKAWATCNLTSVTSVGAPTNGTITQADADVVKAIYRGAFDSNGDQIFWTYRNGTTQTVEAAVAYNTTTGSWQSGQNFFFGTYYQNLVLKTTVAPTTDYTTVSVDDVFDLMLKGLQLYGSFTETTWPDLSIFKKAGGKLIHWHGEQDTNLFPEASAHFHEKVRHAMYPNATGYDEINEFYRFFLVPGAAHCAINAYQPDGPFPQYALQQMIDWVESGTVPTYLNGTTESGSSKQPEICLWPTRPSWDSSGSFSCVNDGNTPSEFIHPLTGWKVDY
ncbi:hypothetical protein Q5752_003845 [Cryptotrichosporon argae]